MDEHTKQLAEAIGTLLDAIEAYSQRRADDPLRKVTDKIKIYRLDEFEAYYDRGQHLVDDPIGQAFRLGIRSIGKALATLGGLASMQEAMAHVTPVRPDDTVGIDIIDKHWDGITTEGWR